jgi:hypothetical protein
MDITKHDLAIHIEAIQALNPDAESIILSRYNKDGTAKSTMEGQQGHTEDWYKFWSDKGTAKCPRCNVEAEFTDD